MKNLIIVSLLSISLTGCEVTNSTFGTKPNIGLAEQQAAISVGQVGVNYYQQKINEQVLANQRLQQENRSLRARSIQPPVIARSIETRSVIQVPKARFLPEVNHKKEKPPQEMKRENKTIKKIQQKIKHEDKVIDIGNDKENAEQEIPIPHE